MAGAAAVGGGRAMGRGQGRVLRESQRKHIKIMGGEGREGR